MIVWYVGATLVATWAVFRDPAFDHRLAALGALVPLAVDAPAGRAGPGHTLAAAVVTLAATMAVTRHRRRLRRHLLAVPVGMLWHLVFDGAWSHPDLLWWPVFGSPGDVPLPEGVRPPALTLGLEAAGLVGVIWFVRRFGLTDRGRLRRFVATGRVPAPGTPRAPTC